MATERPSLLGRPPSRPLGQTVFSNRADQASALPFAGCPTSTCYGNPFSHAEPWLTGPRFFPTTWDDLQALPVPPLTRGCPSALHAADFVRQQHCPLPADPTNRSLRSFNRGRLWASTRRQCTAAKACRTRRSNAWFWKQRSAAGGDSTVHQEVVVSTPPEPEGPSQPRPETGHSKPASPVPDGTPPIHCNVATQPGVRGHRRQSRPRPAPVPVPQLHDLASLLRCKVADDPCLHSAAIACADWVEMQGLPEEALESQLVWQVLEHCSGTPGPLDLPTLAAFADIAIEAQVPGRPKPLSLAIANITKWRQEILHWFQQTGADCLPGTRNPPEPRPGSTG